MAMKNVWTITSKTRKTGWGISNLNKQRKNQKTFAKRKKKRCRKSNENGEKSMEKMKI